MANKQIVVKVPKRTLLNFDGDVISKLNCFYEYKGRRIKNFYLDFSDVKEVDLVGVLILYKFLSYGIVHNCFDSPTLYNFSNNQVLQDRVRYFGFKNLFDELRRNVSSDKEHQRLRVNIEDNFIIAPMSLLERSEISAEYLDKEYTPKIEDYYKDKSVSSMILSVFSEIFLNFWAHSGDEKSIIVAHGNRDYVEIVCADSGIGVVESIINSYPDCNRSEAISTALKKGVTSKRNTNHMGYGLWLVNEIVSKNGGRFKLRSCEYCVDNIAGKMSYSKGPWWIGSIVYVKLSVSKPINIDDVEKNNKSLNDININFQ